MVPILYSHQECMRVPANPYPSQHLLLSVFLILALPTCVYWYLTVILIIIYLMTSNFEHVFMCQLPIHISSSVKCLFTCFDAFFYIADYLFIIELQEFFMYFICKSSIQYSYYGCLFLSVQPTCSFTCVFDEQKLFVIFIRSSINQFFSLDFFSCKEIQEPLLASRLQHYFAIDIYILEGLQFQLAFMFGPMSIANQLW